MSDVLIVVPSESLLALKKAGLKRFKVWGTGAKETLIDFLNRTLPEMSYDHKLHIVTEILEMRYTARCPYLSHGHGTTVAGEGADAVWHCAEEEVVLHSHPPDVLDKRRRRVSR